MLSFLLALVWNICIVIIGFVIFAVLLLLMGYISDMIDYLSMRWTEERLEQERQRHDCKYCFYYKDGKCLTQFENDCKENNYFIWTAKESK